jgi:hypothetical protein
MNKRQRKKATRPERQPFGSRREDPPTWSVRWIWSLAFDEPQRLVFQPRWRKRLWLRSSRYPELATALLNAPGQIVKYFFHGLKRGPRTL